MIEHRSDGIELSMDPDVLALAVDCAGLGVWQIFPATGAWICSPLSKKLLGVGEHGDPAAVLSKEDRKRGTEAIERAMRLGEYRFEFRAGDRWFSAIGRVVRNRRAPASIAGTLQDVTPQKLALEERELRLGEVAHDLLSPLTAIRLGVHVVRRDRKEAPAMLSRIDALVTTVERIVSELLDFSRSRLSEPEQAEVALADVCRSVVADAAIVYPNRQILLDAKDDPVGEWDGERLGQVIRNLIENALQHGSPDTSVELTLTDSGDRAVLSVANRGPPVPDELRAHLFEPFRPKSSKRKGVGLGLYIVKRIVEAHGGSLELSSGKARTVFQVTLPKGRPAVQSAPWKEGFRSRR